MTDTETRNTSDTGGQKGQKAPRLGGADAQALLELARVYGFGELKYERYNYLKGYPYSWSIDAMFRHILKFMSGEDRDICRKEGHPEGLHEWYDDGSCEGSGLLHSAHIAWHALALTAFVQRGIGTDDREPRVEEVAPRAELPVIEHYGVCEHGIRFDPATNERDCALADGECPPDCADCTKVNYGLRFEEASGPVTEFRGFDGEAHHDERQHPEGAYLEGCPRCDFLLDQFPINLTLRPEYSGTNDLAWRTDYEDGVYTEIKEGDNAAA